MLKGILSFWTVVCTLRPSRGMAGRKTTLAAQNYSNMYSQTAEERNKNAVSSLSSLAQKQQKQLYN